MNNEQCTMRMDMEMDMERGERQYLYARSIELEP